MKRYRVLYISNEDSRIGGSSWSMLNMLQALGDSVEPVILFRADGPAAAFFRERGYKCLTEPFYRNSFSAEGLMRIVRFIPHAIARALRQGRCARRVIRKAGRIDIVHSNSSTVDIGLRIAGKMGVPHVWHLREYYDIGIGGKPFPSWASWKRKLFRSDSVIAISKGLYRHWNLDAHRKAFCIPDAVGSSSDITLDVRKEPYVLFLAATMSSVKNPEEAVAIFRKAALPPEYKLKLVGVGAESFAGPSVEAVPVTGDLKPFYVKASAVLVCTRYEGMGRVAVEAMCYGCPVVARNSGGSADVLEGGRFGSLYSSVEEGAAMLREVVLNPPLEKLRAAGENAASMYSVDKYGEKILGVYESVCLK